jgi:hypothetical protein
MYTKAINSTMKKPTTIMGPRVPISAHCLGRRLVKCPAIDIGYSMVSERRKWSTAPAISADAR